MRSDRMKIIYEAWKIMDPCHEIKTGLWFRHIHKTGHKVFWADY